MIKKLPMRNALIFGLILLTSISKGQECNLTTNYLTELKNHNVSNIWTLKKIPWEFEGEKDTSDREPIGFIGSNYQRFYIHFISVIQNPANPLEYYVYGKTMVKNNICKFQGLIEISESKSYIDDYDSSFVQGNIFGGYKFYEDPLQKGAGILKGKFKTRFFIDKDSEIKYNSLEFISDGYSNNEFEGNWTGYKSLESRKCNWGDFRIPDSDELGGGAAEFLPYDKYLKNGWESYRDQISSDNEISSKATEKEEKKWWLDIE
jgi:hypothetical protein